MCSGFLGFLSLGLPWVLLVGFVVEMGAFWLTVGPTPQWGAFCFSNGVYVVPALWNSGLGDGHVQSGQSVAGQGHTLIRSVFNDSFDTRGPVGSWHPLGDNLLNYLCFCGSL